MATVHVKCEITFSENTTLEEVKNNLAENWFCISFEEDPEEAKEVWEKLECVVEEKKKGVFYISYSHKQDWSIIEGDLAGVYFSFPSTGTLEGELSYTKKRPAGNVVIKEKYADKKLVSSTKTFIALD